jgi:hypothetical protein
VNQLQWAEPSNQSFTSQKRSDRRMGQPAPTPTPQPPYCRETVTGPCRQLREEQPQRACRAWPCALGSLKAATIRGSITAPGCSVPLAATLTARLCQCCNATMAETAMHSSKSGTLVTAELKKYAQQTTTYTHAHTTDTHVNRRRQQGLTTRFMLPAHILPTTRVRQRTQII